MANRHFNITWYENEKYGTPVTRRNAVTVVNASPEVGLAAKAAVALFTKTFGSLKKNTIISLQEFNNDGPIGELITPDADNNIVPIKK